ncbi:16S rRNA (guanine(527)-N(7))-methyltransferase RsmG [Candidatus Peregrinibacteria bacterium]|nr:16S rRNA (guanine(527)-N(7))-methyltransferase RsmG [Candidatus Peregrinibacteria bacterium]
MKNIREIFELASLPLSQGEEILLNYFASFIKEWNAKMNLFASCTDETFFIKHILDSAYGIDCIDKKKSLHILDIGTGGGLPGIVLAIFRPLSHFTLMDSTKKKVDAVHDMVERLHLPNVSCVWGRSETLALDPKFHGMYDMVVARAFAPLNRLIPAALPFIKPTGRIMAYKGPNVAEELSERTDLSRNYRVESIKHFELPFSSGKRTLILFSML